MCSRVTSSMGSSLRGGGRLATDDIISVSGGLLLRRVSRLSTRTRASSWSWSVNARLRNDSFEGDDSGLLQPEVPPFSVSGSQSAGTPSEAVQASGRCGLSPASLMDVG